ncbi:uncharacterized protein MONOS_505 [Monocercomonoides exilis]|uniref:uncharacterized protein n=1 Tax=Monocercomonoides exilis TaxID=2049356 RepID=UPI00355A2B0E|nr:hypothetical protein MONOS_505 [Monocercomonoides exilis]|eukprot:MONOS_505.1-p1 / transcript=MONOS_505.1 / gene=MONOS_505 / organism=Monocercomonoides_exilis_PA203 / gene_product=unspecified product / transcript_product=unspecified product / location=Mono_scaffold00008:56608-58955(+) / protein_length=748 / sequence_SO=supercontig / SO=protein_coding / is_pseudo=false
MSYNIAKTLSQAIHVRSSKNSENDILTLDDEIHFQKSHTDFEHKIDECSSANLMMQNATQNCHTYFESSSSSTISKSYFVNEKFHSSIPDSSFISSAHFSFKDTHKEPVNTATVPQNLSIFSFYSSLPVQYPLTLPETNEQSESRIIHPKIESEEKEVTKMIHSRDYIKEVSDHLLPLERGISTSEAFMTLIDKMNSSQKEYGIDDALSSTTNFQLTSKKKEQVHDMDFNNGEKKVSEFAQYKKAMMLQKWRNNDIELQEVNGIGEKYMKMKRQKIAEEIQDAKKYQKIFGKWVRKEWITDESEQQMWDLAEEKIKEKETNLDMELTEGETQEMTLEEIKSYLKDLEEGKLSATEVLEMKLKMEKKEKKMEKKTKRLEMTDISVYLNNTEKEQLKHEKRREREKCEQIAQNESGKVPFEETEKFIEPYHQLLSQEFDEEIHGKPSIQLEDPASIQPLDLNSSSPSFQISTSTFISKVADIIPAQSELEHSQRSLLSSSSEDRSLRNFDIRKLSSIAECPALSNTETFEARDGQNLRQFTGNRKLIQKTENFDQSSKNSMDNDASFNVFTSLFDSDPSGKDSDNCLESVITQQVWYDSPYQNILLCSDEIATLPSTFEDRTITLPAKRHFMPSIKKKGSQLPSAMNLPFVPLDPLPSSATFELPLTVQVKRRYTINVLIEQLCILFKSASDFESVNDAETNVGKRIDSNRRRKQREIKATIQTNWKWHFLMVPRELRFPWCFDRLQVF